MWVVVGVVALVVLVATYLTWTAARVDRLHARTVATYAALDAQSLRRAVTAAGLGDQARAAPPPAPRTDPPDPPAAGASPGSPPESACADGAADLPGMVDLRAAAKAVLAAGPDDRELAENDLTRAVRSVAANAAAFGAHDDRLVPVVEANRRLALARQVHNDLVRDALALRRRPLVRLLRLARRHPQPRYFDIDEPTLPG